MHELLLDLGVRGKRDNRGGVYGLLVFVFGCISLYMFLTATTKNGDCRGLVEGDNWMMDG
jgi:hypothetical protein